MKKYLPFIILGLGVLVLVVGAIVVFKGKKSAPVEEEETALIDVVLADRPVVKLTPRPDGHWLDLTIDKLQIDAASLDYELLYKLPDGRTQGVPGSVNLSGVSTIQKELLLGSESSGKFRYDEGVESGTLTLRFRNDKGKLLAKFVSDFALLNGTAVLSSVDGAFKYTLAKSSKDYFVVMQTVGVPAEAPGEPASGPWGVFSSASAKLPGTIETSGTLYALTGSEWKLLSGGSASDIGYFFTSN